MQLGGRICRVSLDEVLSLLTRPLPSLLRDSGTKSFCLDLKARSNESNLSRYLSRRDRYREEDVFWRERRWGGITSSFAAGIAARKEDSMGVVAFKNRIIWDKHRTGRHLNFGREADDNIQVCLSCNGGAETQQHILTQCEHPHMLASRAACMERIGIAIARAVKRDPVEARFYEAYHELVLRHPEGYTLITGMLTAGAQEAVDELRLPTMDTKILYGRLVKHCRCYAEMCTDMYGARRTLLEERELTAGQAPKPRVPPLVSPSFRASRPMTDTRTDYPGIDSLDWRSSGQHQPTIDSFWSRLPTEERKRRRQKGQLGNVSHSQQPLITACFPASSSTNGGSQDHPTQRDGADDEVRRQARLALEMKRTRRADASIARETRPLLGGAERRNFDSTSLPAGGQRFEELRVSAFTWRSNGQTSCPKQTKVVRLKRRIKRTAVTPLPLNTVVSSVPFPLLPQSTRANVPARVAVPTPFPHLSDLLVHGISSDGALAVTLDLRAYSPEGSVGLGRDQEALIQALLVEIAENLVEPDAIALTVRTLRLSPLAVFHFSRRLDTSLFERTNNNGMCGYIMSEQLAARAESSSRDNDQLVRETDLWDRFAREALIQALRDLPRRVRDYRCESMVSRLIDWIDSHYPEGGRAGHPEPFLPRDSNLWFNSQWLQALVGRCDFQFFSALDEYWPRGSPPFPDGHGMLHWDSGGERRLFSFPQLQQSLLNLNMAAIQGNHYFLLPTPDADNELARHEEALADLACKLVRLLQRQGGTVFPLLARSVEAPICIDSGSDSGMEVSMIPESKCLGSRSNIRSVKPTREQDEQLRAHTYVKEGKEDSQAYAEEALLEVIRKTVHNAGVSEDTEMVTGQGGPSISSRYHTTAAGGDPMEHREVSRRSAANERVGIG